MKNAKHDEIIYARVPDVLRAALERERERLSEEIGIELKLSAVIRSLLEQALRGKRAASERAA